MTHIHKTIHKVLRQYWLYCKFEWRKQTQNVCPNFHTYFKDFHSLSPPWILWQIDHRLPPCWLKPASLWVLDWTPRTTKCQRLEKLRGSSSQTSGLHIHFLFCQKSYAWEFSLSFISYYEISMILHVCGHQKHIVFYGTHHHPILIIIMLSVLSSTL